MITTETNLVQSRGSDRHGSSALGSYRPGLDGLRAVGMSAVLLYHAELGVPGAFLALSQFFTLSGFLVTSMLLRANDRGGINMGQFWVRRLRRLMPASLVCLVGIAVFGATVATYEQARDLPAQIFAAATNVVNWYFAEAEQGYVAHFADPSPVHHFWSLAVEEQFYLVLSVGLVLLFRRTRDRRVLAAVFGLGAVASTLWMARLYSGGASLDRIYLGTDTRLAELFVGALLAVVVAGMQRELSERMRRLIAILGAAAFAITIWLWMTLDLAPGRIWQGGMLLFAVGSALVILSLLVDRGPVAAVLRVPAVAAYGRITYGVYLYHLPIFLVLTPERTGLDGWALFVPRFVATIVVAVVSYHFVEQPIRRGAGADLPRFARRAVAPVATVLVVLVGFVVVDRGGVDPQITIRDDGSSLAVPVVPDDGTLDVLAITDDQGAKIAEALERLGADGSVDVTRSRFGCDTLTASGVCADWRRDWTSMVEEANPDVVLLYLEVWAADDIAELTGIEPGSVDELTAAARQILDDGLDRLSARGAPVLFAQPGAAIDVALRRSRRPFDRAMDLLETSRSDLRRVLALPDQAEATAAGEHREETAEAILTDLYLYQRAERDRLRRVMVVGDSQARSLGYGLERWAATEDRAVVWNVAQPGCGLADEGRIPAFLGGDQPVPDDCKEAVAALSGKVESFDPEVVVVLTSAWDTAPRTLREGGEKLTMADEALKKYLREEYEAATDVLSAHGAHVVWMTAPCVDDFSAGEGVEGLDQRASALNEDVIEPVVEARRDVATSFDLAGVLCPDGRAIQELDDGGELRPDGVHFSAESSLWFASTYGEEVLSAR